MTNKTSITISSPVLKAPIDSENKKIRGFHFCKLFSPARALEWIYIDSLKQNPLQ
jgi:hypothetical protein